MVCKEFLAASLTSTPFSLFAPLSHSMAARMDYSAGYRQDWHRGSFQEFFQMLPIVLRPAKETDRNGSAE